MAALAVLAYIAIENPARSNKRLKNFSKLLRFEKAVELVRLAGSD